MTTLVLKTGEQISLADNERIAYKLYYRDLGLLAFTTAKGLKPGVIASLPSKDFALYTIMEINHE
jgi:hypothetical protein